MIGSLIGLFLVYLAYIYLRNLSNCSCVNQVFVERLKNIETLILGLSIFSIITSLIINIFMNDLMSKIKSFATYILYGFIILALIMLIIYAYFIYDTYMFSSTMSIPCDCADGWQKYYIYFQAIVMIFIILGSISTGIKMILSPTLPDYGYKGNNYNKNYKRNKNKRSRK